jgi:hypothetical protein
MYPNKRATNNATDKEDVKGQNPFFCPQPAQDARSGALR